MRSLRRCCSNEHACYRRPTHPILQQMRTWLSILYKLFCSNLDSCTDSTRTVRTILLDLTYEDPALWLHGRWSLWWYTLQTFNWRFWLDNKIIHRAVWSHGFSLAKAGLSIKTALVSFKMDQNPRCCFLENIGSVIGITNRLWKCHNRDRINVFEIPLILLTPQILYQHDGSRHNLWNAPLRLVFSTVLKVVESLCKRLLHWLQDIERSGAVRLSFLRAWQTRRVVSLPGFCHLTSRYKRRYGESWNTN